MKQAQRLIGGVAVFFGLTAAFAFEESDELRHIYGVSGETATSWIIIMELTTETEGEDYSCGPPSTVPCTVTSNETISFGKISKIGAVIKSANRKFVP